MSKKKPDKDSIVLLEQCLQFSEKLKTQKIIVVCENFLFCQYVESFVKSSPGLSLDLILVLPTPKMVEKTAANAFYCDFNAAARPERLEYIFRTGIETGKLKKGEMVLCLYSFAGIKLLDTIQHIKVEEHFSPVSHNELRKITCNIPLELLSVVINLAMEISREGREGTPVGTILVIGDTDKVMKLSKPMIFNPFRGYPEEERKIFNPKVQEVIKELTLIDGAFIIRDDGVVVAAGMFLHAGAGKRVPIKGLGTRHAAASALSFHTSAIAVTVSESNGTVRIFSKGKVVKTIRLSSTSIVSRRGRKTSKLSPAQD